MKKNILCLLLILPTLAFSKNNSDIKVNAVTTAGCNINANNIHFDFAQNQSVKATDWHAYKQSVFNLDKFLNIDIQCSKGVSFYLAGDSNSSPEGSLFYNLSHNTNVNAPQLSYWFNNWSTAGYSTMMSSNISRLQTSASRLANRRNNLYYKVNDGNPAWIKFAVQVEGDNIYKYEAGNYSDNVTILLTY